ncbi:MAG: hypothetical protein PHF11_06460 [Candidatus Omnitrophica bacterium]|nr:hypothetical protein [Candidatus Omnitrophota bacterium]
MTAEATKVEAPSPAPVVEKQTNCLGCNKPIKKLRRYYRDGKFYCTKKCWRKSIKDIKDKETKA